jgi:hypothetical protein
MVEKSKVSDQEKEISKIKRKVEVVEAITKLPPEELIKLKCEIIDFTQTFVEGIKELRDLAELLERYGFLKMINAKLNQNSLEAESTTGDVKATWMKIVGQIYSLPQQEVNILFVLIKRSEEEKIKNTKEKDNWAEKGIREVKNP